MSFALGCTGCGYRKYIANGKSMCTHKKAQVELIRQGKPPAMAPSQYVERCPYARASVVNDDVGAISTDYLDRISISDKLTRAKQPERQSSMF